MTQEQLNTMLKIVYECAKDKCGCPVPVSIRDKARQLLDDIGGNNEVKQ